MTTLDRADVPTAVTPPTTTTNAPRSRPAALVAALATFRAIGGGLLVVLCAVTITFIVTRVLTPDPTHLFLGSAGFANAEAEAQARARIQEQLGLDKPILVQYVTYLGDIAQGDLGASFQTGRPVTADLLDRLPATAELAVLALTIGISIGVVGGILAARRPRGWADRIVSLLTLGGLAIPQFWIGIMLVWIFTVKLQLLPPPVGRLPVGVVPPPHVTGFYLPDALISGNIALAGQAAAQLVLPTITLAVGLAAPIAKVVRTSMSEALTSDYIRTARALGFGGRRITFVYALKNGLLPVVTILAGIVAFTFVGSILVEGVFGWPGVGAYSLQAIRTSDFPVVQGFVLYASALYVVVYELLTVTYRLIDPRARA